VRADNDRQLIIQDHLEDDPEDMLWWIMKESTFREMVRKRLYMNIHTISGI